MSEHSLPIGWDYGLYLFKLAGNYILADRGIYGRAIIEIGSSEISTKKTRAMRSQQRLCGGKIENIIKIIFFYGEIGP